MHGQSHIYIVEADLRHMFGTYTGTIRIGSQQFKVGRLFSLSDNVFICLIMIYTESFQFSAQPGIFEDHYALW